MVAEQRRARIIGFRTEMVARTLGFDQKTRAEHVFSEGPSTFRRHFP